MRCYSWKRGALSRGIAVTDPNQPVPRIFLAQDGVLYDDTLQLYRTNPPDTRQDASGFYIDDAYISTVTRRDQSRVPTLCKPYPEHQGDLRVIVHVTTYYAPMASPTAVDGFVRFELGDAESIFEHHMRNAHAAWAEYVLRLSPGSAVIICTETKRCAQYVLSLDEDGVLESIPLPQYYTEQALLRTEVY